MAQKRRHVRDNKPMEQQPIEGDEAANKSRHQPLPSREQSDGVPERTKDGTGQPNLDC